MRYNEWIPNGGWMRYNRVRSVKAAAKGLVEAVAPFGLVAGLLGAYWIVAFLECV